LYLKYAVNLVLGDKIGGNDLFLIERGWWLMSLALKVKF